MIHQVAPFHSSLRADDSVVSRFRRVVASGNGAEGLGEARAGLRAFAGFAIGVLDACEAASLGLARGSGGAVIEEQDLLILCPPDVASSPDKERTSAASGGDILCIDLAQAWEPVGEGRVLALLVPRSLVRLAPTVIEAAHRARLDADTGLGRVLAGQIALLAKAAQGLSAQEGAALTETVSALVTTLFTKAAPQGDAAMTDLPLAAIQAFIGQNLARPDLSQALICREFGLSRSALYRLFAPLGGVAGVIRERRLDCAKRYLSMMGDKRVSVARIAAAAGFPSDAAFTRAFRQRFGIAPSAVSPPTRLACGTGLEDATLWRRRWLDNSRIQDGPVSTGDGATPRWPPRRSGRQSGRALGAGPFHASAEA